ncbi:MAG: bifunctional DNA-formamidopyrimidine glycosylase/DNA-(apurinic or apyrimidinic site) lyase [Bdellovibrionales bacterium]|jgi:formamidopyrimidine-DNA glycosylase|nr:bifunctional DNA-formamidopyrimidine glycosylase/DNA-(apurinic or apyrimidinic site) lyase [Bdellovibrionales bacterium]
MPELPEVEHVKNQLKKLVLGQEPCTTRITAKTALDARVAQFESFRKDLRFPIPRTLAKRVAGQEILDIERRAKYLLFRFEQGWLLSHLGMTGAWREVADLEPLILHDHIRLKFVRGLTLVFNDPRRFGFVDWVEKGKLEEHPRLSHLGPEPLSDEFTGEALYARLRKRSAPIKSLIMDQRIVVGVGNIYASEALFRIGVRPTRAAGRLTRAECERLATTVREVLTEAILAGGSTIRDYRGVDGGKGGFQSRFFVYDRKGEPCRVCKSLILSKMIATRSTYWCPRCQV